MKKFLLLLAIAALMIYPFPAIGETEEAYQLLTEDGKRLTTIGREPEEGDEYISGENGYYRVIGVDRDKKTAVLESLGDYEMPDVSWLNSDETLPVGAFGGERKVALYCTHSDESYEPTDGQSSLEPRGTIYDVAAALKEAFENQGVTAELSENTHHPHDAGAYRRSRQTAVALLKNGPDAIFDIHRDGIPDPDEYVLTLGGKPASKVRLLVGRKNQNSSANKEFATRIKAVGDSMYPGLIKDIYIGKGTYNQDLSPRSVLLEFGTHTISRERVTASAEPMARVLTRAMYGGVVGAAGQSDVSSGAKAAEKTPAEESSAGAGSGIWWIIGIFAAGIIVFALISTGSRQGTMEKVKRSVSEMTGGLIGKKPKE